MRPRQIVFKRTLIEFSAPTRSAAATAGRAARGTRDSMQSVWEP